MPIPKIRVFVSSPGDVAEERVIAGRVLDRLAAEFARVARIEAVFWEHEPLLATETFQKQIIRPSETDIVVTILWSRLGTRLPKDIQRPDGTNYDSGTEFEFEDAVEGRRRRGAPDLIVYRKMAEPTVSLSDPTNVRDRLDQKQALDNFIQSWFHGEDGTIVAAFHPFDEVDQFEGLLETHLHKLVRARLQAKGIAQHADAETITPRPTWTSGSPFRGLDVFEIEHAPIFFGRTRATSEILHSLRKQFSRGKGFLLIAGQSGCGKSSLIRAGVLPMLARPGVIEGVGLWRRVILRPSDFSGDLFDGLAAALLDDDALPELAADGTKPAQIAADLRKSPHAADMLIKGALSQAAGLLQMAEGASQQPQARLVLLIDQFEELFTFDAITPGVRERFVTAISSLAKSGRALVIATIRSDFYHRCLELPELVALKEGTGQYDLLPPSSAEISQLIRRPAQAAGLRFEVHPDTEESLDDVLRDAASADPECLPLLEFTLEELYKRRRDNIYLTHQAYEELGGVEGAVATRADKVFSELDEPVRAAFPQVFRKLVAVGSGQSEKPIRRLAHEDEIRGTPQAAEFVDRFIEARLLVGDKASDGGAVVRVTHEALLTAWQPLVDWFHADCELLRIRSRVAAAAARWDAEGRSGDLLLPRGKPLEEGIALVAAGFDLGELEEAFVAASSARSRGVARLKMAAIVALVMLTVAAVSGGLVATSQYFKARDSETAALDAQADAESARDDADRSRIAAVEQRNLAQYELGRNYWSTAVTQRDTFNNPLSAAHHFTKAAVEFAHFPAESQNARLAAEWSARSCRLVAAFEHEHETITNRYAKPIVTCNANASRVFVATQHGPPRLWNGISGQQLAQLGDEQLIDGAVFSNDESGVITWRYDAVEWWDSATGQLMRRYESDVKISNLEVSANRSRLLTTARGGAELLDANSGDVLARFETNDQLVEGTALSSDAQHFAIWSKGGRLTLWDVDQSQAVHEVEIEHGIDGARYISDGSQLLIWTHGPKVCLLNARTGEEIVAFDHIEGSILAADFNADESQIVTSCQHKGGRESTVRVWNVMTGEMALQFTHSNTTVYAKFCFADNRIVSWGSGTLAAGAEAATQLRDATSGEVIASHPGSLQGVQVVDNASRLLTWGSGKVQIWDATRFDAPLAFVQSDAEMSGAQFSPDLTRILSWTKEGRVRIWDATATPLLHAMVHDHEVFAAYLSTDAKSIYTRTGTIDPEYDGGVRIWDAESGRLITDLDHDEFVGGFALSSDESRMLTWSSPDASNSRPQANIRLWDIATRRVIHRFLVDDYVKGARFDEAEKRILVWDGERYARIWDVETGAQLAEFDHGSSRPVYDADFDADERRVLTWGNSEIVRLWDIDTGEVVVQNEHNAFLRGANFDAQKQRVLSWDDAGVARLWDAKTGDTVIQFDHPADERFIQDAQLNQSETRLLTQAEGGAARLWNVANGELMATLTHDGRMTAAHFNRDESSLLTASTDGTIKLWDAVTGDLVWRIKVDIELADICFSKDETRILARDAFADDSAWLIDVTIGDVIARIRTSGKSVRATFNEDESRLFTWGDDRTLRVWDVSAADEVSLDSLETRLEALTGTRLNELGQVEALSPKEWFEAKQSLPQAAR